MDEGSARLWSPDTAIHSPTANVVDGAAEKQDCPREPNGCEHPPLWPSGCVKASSSACRVHRADTTDQRLELVGAF